MTRELSLFHKFMDDALTSAFPTAVATGCSYPPTDIEKHSDGAFTVTLAVAGFKKNELRVMTEQETLVITGEREAREADSGKVPTSAFIQRGIARRKFRREFALGDALEVGAVELKDGLLTISLGVTIPPTVSTVDIPIF